METHTLRYEVAALHWFLRALVVAELQPPLKAGPRAKSLPAPISQLISMEAALEVEENTMRTWIISSTQR
jgi:hypothetical protein